MSRFGGGQLNGDQPELLLVELRRTCMSCPAQWEGKTLEGAYFYARCRHGRVRASLNVGDSLDPNATPFVIGTVEQVSLFTLGYAIEDEPSTAELLKMIGAELVPEAGDMSTSDGLGR